MIYKCTVCGKEREETVPVLPTVYTVTVRGFGELHLPEDGKYTLRDFEKAGYKILKWLTVDGKEFPTEGTVSANVTVYPVFDVLPTTTVEELEERAAAGAELILIANDITIDRTIYVTGKTVIYSDTPVTLKRAADFTGDLFVVGRDAGGNPSIMNGVRAELTLGLSGGDDEQTLLTVDGNRDGVTAEVNGTCFFLLDSGKLTMHGGVKICNNLKVANERLFEIDSFYLGKSTTVGGGAIYCGSEISIADCTFTTNSATISGGAVYAAADVDLTDCTFTNNSAEDNGGAVYSVADLVIAGSSFTANEAKAGGAVSHNLKNATSSVPTLTVSGSVFSENSATTYGGAISVIGSAASVGNCNFTSNSASTRGGAIYVAPLSYDTKISGSTISCVKPGSLTVTGGTFTGNFTEKGGSSYYGGAIAVFSGSQATVSGATFTENESYSGGAIASYGSGKVASANGSSYTTQPSLVTLNECEFTQNAGANGGVVYVGGMAQLEVNGSTFDQNTASGSGAVIYMTSASATTVTVTAATVYNNNTAKSVTCGFIHVANAKNLLYINKTATTLVDADTDTSITITNGVWAGLLKNPNSATVTEITSSP